MNGLIRAFTPSCHLPDALCSGLMGAPGWSTIAPKAQCSVLVTPLPWHRGFCVSWIDQFPEQIVIRCGFALDGRQLWHVIVIGTVLRIALKPSAV